MKENQKAIHLLTKLIQSRMLSEYISVQLSFVRICECKTRRVIQSKRFFVYSADVSLSLYYYCYFSTKMIIFTFSALIASTQNNRNRKKKCIESHRHQSSLLSSPLLPLLLSREISHTDKCKKCTHTSYNCQLTACHCSVYISFKCNEETLSSGRLLSHQTAFAFVVFVQWTTFCVCIQVKPMCVVCCVFIQL